MARPPTLIDEDARLMRNRARRLSDRAIVDENRIGPGFLLLACAGYWSARMRGGDMPQRARALTPPSDDTE